MIPDDDRGSAPIQVGHRPLLSLPVPKSARIDPQQNPVVAEHVPGDEDPDERGLVDLARPGPEAFFQSDRNPDAAPTGWARPGDAADGRSAMAAKCAGQTDCQQHNIVLIPDRLNCRPSGRPVGTSTSSFMQSVSAEVWRERQLGARRLLKGVARFCDEPSRGSGGTEVHDVALARMRLVPESQPSG